LHARDCALEGLWFFNGSTIRFDGPTPTDYFLRLCRWKPKSPLYLAYIASPPAYVVTALRCLFVNCFKRSACCSSPILTSFLPFSHVFVALSFTSTRGWSRVMAGKSIHFNLYGFTSILLSSFLFSARADLLLTYFVPIDPYYRSHCTR
jgi:hypothetical protein